ncbi:MAG: hypothetical protein ACRECH_12995 [Nitrososphaerales archaeon]
MTEQGKLRDSRRKDGPPTALLFVGALLGILPSYIYSVANSKTFPQSPTLSTIERTSFKSASQQPLLAHKTTVQIRKPSALAPTGCFGIGDTITVTGQTSFVNGGTEFVLYQPRAKGFCVCYPKPTDHIALTDLGTIGDKLPQNVYLEVTGVLTDQWPVVSPIGFKVTSFRNVDAEIKAEIAEWTRRCTQWQDKQLAIMSKRLHGGNTARFTDALGGKCGVGGVDAQLPHEEIGPIWRRNQ